MGDLCLVISILFVLARRHNLMPKKNSWLYVLVVPYGTCMLTNFELSSAERSVEFQFHGSFRSNLERTGLEISTRKLAKCEWFFEVASLKNIL